MAHNAWWWDNRYGGGGPRMFDEEAQAYMPIQGGRRPSKYAVWASQAYKAAQAVPVMAGMYMAPQDASRKRVRVPAPQPTGKPVKAAKTNGKKSFTKQRAGVKMPRGKYRKSRLPRKRKRQRSRRNVKRRRGMSRRRSHSQRSSLMRQIRKEIWKKSHQSITQDYRIGFNDVWKTGENTANLALIDQLDMSKVEFIVDATMPTIDGSTIVWKDLLVADSSATIKTVGGFYKIEVRNNHEHDARLTFYHNVPVEDTTQDSRGWYEKCIQDYVITGGAQTAVTNAEDSYLYSLKDVYKTFKKRWRIIQTRHIQLRPGEAKTLIFPLPKGSVDLLEYNNSGTEFQKGFSSQIMAKIRGGIAHGSGDTVGMAGTEIDMIGQLRWKYVVVKGDQQRKSETGLDNFDTMTDGAEQVHPDNEEVADGAH